MSKTSKSIASIRESIIAEIKKAVESFRTKKIDLGESCYDNCPILQDANNDEDIFVLDEIYLHDGKLRFSGSSSWNNDTWDEDTISTDALVGISEELDGMVSHYQDYIEDEATYGENRYVMGYSQAENMDLVVYADTYEEAEEKWEDGYFLSEEHDEEYYGKEYYEKQKIKSAE